ncbi:TRAP transporter large permease subunit [Halobacteriovorax sp. XZX-3]|uniref:TRAP transporter large permease n=1 Tax=unclassified Halobacteriovorax TaxID=2639665 RepID=UPI000CD02A3D|nr:TRAP transporter large permease subunit [Halobacteriovorax sp. DA5]POB12490.1 C4-dicarboxylate ABC transporter [Halobacteriovorax sp. DA5]
MSLITISIAAFILALIGVPLFVVLGSLALAAFFHNGIEPSAVSVEIYRLASAPTILTIPLFTFAGYLLAESNAPKRLFRFTNALLSWMPGGVAIVGLVLCAFFTAFTGASGVTIVALGGLIYPILMNRGHDDKFTMGFITTSGSLGLLFPPSLPIILYGIVAGVDIDQLFKAGIVPGMLLIIGLAIYSILKAPKNHSERGKFDLKEALLSLKGAAFELFLAPAVLVGIYGGIVTVTEAAAFTAFYILMIECFVYRDLSFTKDVPKIVVDSMTMVGAILIILCCALGLTNFLVDEEVPNQLFGAFNHILTNKYAFLAFLNIFLLIVGSLMDIFSAIIVVVPLILPLAQEFDIHPIHLAIVFLTNLEIGYITPPVGINLFISSIRFKRPITELYRSALPFLLILLICLAIITYVPALSLIWVK